MEKDLERDTSPAFIDNGYAPAVLSHDRAAAYGLLARLFREEIDSDTFDDLRFLQQQSTREDDIMSKGIGLIESYVSVDESEKASRLIELAVDFVRVFVGHGTDGHSAAYPYESVYTSDKRLVMQQARKEVAAVYASHGVGSQPSWKEGEDHLAAELEFMQILCLRGCGSKDVLTSQKIFLESHLLNWAPLMAADMMRFAKTDFYRGLAFMLKGFLVLDGEFLASTATA